MPSIYDLKSKFQGLLRPVTNNLAKAGVTANKVTLCAIALSALGGALLMRFGGEKWPWLLLPVILFVRMALNAIDGMLAREHNMKSKLGAVLNELGDVISDTLLYLPFAFLNDRAAILVVLICVFAVISEMAGVVAIQIGASRRYDGPMGKSDRAFAFGLAGVLHAFGLPGQYLNMLFGAVFLLLLFTTFNRSRRALEEAK